MHEMEEAVEENSYKRAVNCWSVQVWKKIWIPDFSF
jgi:hypothetical protein